MYQGIKKFFVVHEWLLVVSLAVVFVLIRLPGVNLPLHQDEYKWPMIVNPANQSEVSIPHPPLSQFIYRTAGYIVGFNVHFRFVPLLFGALNLLLLYYLLSFLYDRRTATVGSLIWILSYFSVLASLMVDTDGEIMPFFFLLALIGYYKLQTDSSFKKYWIVLLVGACTLGFLVKVSFALAILAIGADFLWSKRRALTKRQYLVYGGYGLGTIVGLPLLLVVMKFIFPFFDLSTSVSYWEHFVVSNRGWFQTFIQCAKALLYASPFLVVIPFFGSKKNYSKLGPLVFFLIFAFFFYVVLFDFSIGALDRYLQLLVLPLSVLSGVTISSLLSRDLWRLKEFLLLGSGVTLIILASQGLEHFVPSLYPKSEWISRMILFKWTFLYPFSGGSGPLGFYVSFLFMALTWISFMVAFVWSKIKPQFTALTVAFLLPLGVAYNGVFIEEYLFGGINGSAPQLVSDTVSYIRTNPEISKVLVYNDNGGNEVRETGKYERRVYAVPGFESTYADVFKEFHGHFLYIDIPRVMKNSLYESYINSCSVIYEKKSGEITGRVYDCRNNNLNK